MFSGKKDMTACPCEKFRSPVTTFAEVQERCRASAEIRGSLDSVATGDWFAVLRCRECGSFWAEEWPFSESHGGGPPCYYRIAATDAHEWLHTHEPFTHTLRQQSEDLAFYQSLAPEVGPESCAHPTCSHRRIQHSVFCQRHHFEMIKRKPCPL